jgi:hypothetical protein
VRNYFCKSALPLRSICNSLTYDRALLHRRFIFIIVLILCTNGLYCNKAPSSPHLALQTSKDYKTLGNSFFRIDVELDTRPEGKQHMIVCVCVREREIELLNPRERKEEDTGGDRISRVTRRPMIC